MANKDAPRQNTLGRGGRQGMASKRPNGPPNTVALRAQTTRPYGAPRGQDLPPHNLETRQLVGLLFVKQ
eukprot:1103509-Lingulodinium_polyedra.AAC.1